MDELDDDYFGGEVGTSENFPEAHFRDQEQLSQAPGGASGVSTSCGDPIGGSVSQTAVRS